MATIEEAVRQMIVNNAGGLPTGRISYGYRPQFDALPAVTFTLSQNADAVVGGALMTAQLSVNGIADTTLEAAQMVPTIIAALDPGTYDGIKIHAVVITSHQTEDPVTGISDEQEPAIATVTATLYYEP